MSGLARAELSCLLLFGDGPPGLAAGFGPCFLGWARGYSQQHPPGTDVFIDVRPMNPFAVSDNLKAVALRRRRPGQPPRPRQRNADGPPVGELGDDDVLGDLEGDDARFTTG